ncbi:MAG: Crp/Fnr family transcriptional regulator [Deltaproteobacteria bacterium]|jgi:CRP/FNR family transcriptional regulator|nr:Crp/Fnr family transcriptional regulator [Deltaproteobacteria bacterium]
MKSHKPSERKRGRKKPPSPEVLLASMRGYPFFEALPEELNRRLAALAVARNWKAGDLIFSRGDKASGFHLVGGGKVRIFVSEPSGKERTLKIAAEGELFGEAAVFQRQGYPASSAALTAALTFFFPKDAMLSLIGENPELAFATIGVLSARLQHFAGLLEGSLKELLPRLAGYLLELPEENGRCRLPIKKAELARHLGVTAESISRALGELKVSGLIREEVAGAFILNRRLLEERAEGM